MRTLRTLAALAALALLLSCAGVAGKPAAAQDEAQAAGEPRNATIVVLHTNDHHGHPLKFFEFPGDGQGGLPARATFVRQVRAENENVLVLDAGDINTGRPESMFFDAEADIKGYSSIGYDAVTLGNHEFDKPRAVLRKQMADAAFPFLSANIKYESGAYFATPWIIKRFGAVSVGIFGLTTSEMTAIAGDVDTLKGLVIEDEVVAARKMVDVLRGREKVDVVIALVHMGSYATRAEGSRRLAAQVPGIDLIIDGHTHAEDIMASGHWDMKAPFVENGVPIVAAPQWGLQVGKAVLRVEDGRVEDVSWELVPINRKKLVDGKPVFVTSEIPEDPELLAALEPYGKKVDAVLSERIGEAGGAFPSEDVRKAETALGNLVADAMLWKTKSMGADFAIVNSGGIRSAIPQGELRKKHIYASVPYDNSVFLLSLKGSDVVELFRFIGTVKQGKGAFPQVSDGVSFTFDPAAGTVSGVLVGGRPIDPEKTYRIATNSFLAGGGEGYAVMKKSILRYDTSIFQRDVVIEYIQSLDGPVQPALHERIRVVGSVSMAWRLDDAA
jgi:5'-nucleotidase / UDP-sugar diphosphatase